EWLNIVCLDVTQWSMCHSQNSCGVIKHRGWSGKRGFTHTH
ncbi:hypothetical protein DOY81_008462, partial [Sarcophaga bullata]